MDKKNSSYTDDTVMTLAVGKSLVECNGNYSKLKEILIKNMVTIGKNHLQCGFGGNCFKVLTKY